ncbi:MAG: hypothetical protein R6X15_07540 [Pseudomonadota bacterium]
MRFIHKAMGLILGVTVLSTVFVSVAQAVPSFARQTGMACVSCHANNFPALNAFGRSFRAQGYTMRGAADLIEGDGMSLPAELKVSLITKLRYQVDGSVDGNRGEVQWPDEAALLIGGRASENIGFLLEAGMGPQEGEGAFHLQDTNGDGVIDENDEQEVGSDVTGNFLSFKTHFNATDNIAAVLFGTDGLGVGYGMELMNTGLQRSQRPIENRAGYSAGQRLGTASGEATGLALVYHSNNLMVNYSHWAPTWSNVNANVLGGLGHYLRVNYFMNVSGWDMGFGANIMDGTIEVGANDPAEEINVASSGVDFQALGEIASMPAELYMSYGMAPKGSETAPETYNNSTTDDATAYGMLGKLGVIPNTSVYLGYGSTDYGSETISDATIGVQYMLAQNAKLELYHVSSDSDDDADDYTMLMLFAGF